MADEIGGGEEGDRLVLHVHVFLPDCGVRRNLRSLGYHTSILSYLSLMLPYIECNGRHEFRSPVAPPSGPGRIPWSVVQGRKNSNRYSIMTFDGASLTRPADWRHHAGRQTARLLTTRLLREPRGPPPSCSIQTTTLKPSVPSTRDRPLDATVPCSSVGVDTVVFTIDGEIAG